MKCWAVTVAVTLAACTGGEQVGSNRQPLEAYCQANVLGTGIVDVETEYLANVVNCENGNAAFEALKAQAVAARTYLYYKLDTSGSIADGTSDQVYSCGREPRAEHFEAVAATRGIVLQYTGRTIAGFFVAGSRQSPPSCMGGSDDPTNTERYVTYNQGLSGDGITQTILGFVDPDNIFNRGCMSQNGTHCLAESGWSYEDMMPFYYGEDIELVQTEGPCIDPPDAGMPDGGADGGVDGGPPDVGPVTDAAPSPDGMAPYVPVVAPMGGGTPLSSGCSAGAQSAQSGAWSAFLLLLLAGRRKFR